VALVDQDARLFAGTIRDNVRLGRPDAEEHDVNAVLGQAHLTDWVGSLPLGLETPVGEGGARVSGGQRQRIALARALLSGGPILLLDEPTAGLDEETAAHLLADVLREAGRRRSVLMVTHRQAEVTGFDEVAVVEGGRVVERTALRS
jgi:ABC-type multidrug transport system fused ATPase/permease subunit